MIRSLAIQILMLSFLVSPGLCQIDESVSPAVKDYQQRRYSKAREEFVKASDRSRGETLKFLQYAVKSMGDLKAYFEELELLEADTPPGPSDDRRVKDLARKHLFLAGKIMQKEFYLSLVEPHLTRALELDPKNLEAHSDLANAYYSAMQYANAIEWYKKLLALSPGTLPAYKMAGDASVALGDFDGAKKFYQDLLSENDKAVFKYDPSEIEKVRQVINILPRTYKDIDKLIEDGRKDEAEVILKERLSVNGSDYIAMTELAHIYQARGDRKAALRLLTTAIKIAPDYPPAHLFLGRLYFLMRDYDRSVDELGIFKDKMRLLSNMDKETKEMYINSLKYLCGVYYTLERYEDFRQEIYYILRMDPKDQESHYNLAMYYYVCEHNRWKTYESLKKTIALAPDTEVAKDAEYAIEYMRANPDSRVIPDFSFIDKE